MKTLEQEEIATLRLELCSLRAKLEHAEKERANWEAVAEHRFQELEALQAKLDLAERVAADITEALNQLHVKLDQAKLKSADRLEWQAVAMKVSNERDALLAKLDASERIIELLDAQLNIQHGHSVETAQAMECFRGGSTSAPPRSQQGQDSQHEHPPR